MIIPINKAERESLYQDLVARCFTSREDRISRYNVLRNYYLYGDVERSQPVEYNKLYSHIDLLCSFLFSGETTAFSIEVPFERDEADFQFHLSISEKIKPRVNDMWHDSNTDIVFNEALTWALVYDTAFVKLVPFRAGEIVSFVIQPHDVGVLREDLPFMSSQEAIAHQFFMSESVLKRRIHHFTEKDQKLFLSRVKDNSAEKLDSDLPKGAQTLIINAVSPDLVGEINKMDMQYDFGAFVQEPGVMCQELWVYDDEKKDYRCVTIVDGDLILYENDDNPFIAGEIPFIKITPNMVYNYFWGRSEMMYLIPLQKWVNERIPQLRTIMGKQADPPTEMTGFDGVTEEKYAAFMKAGGFWGNSSPASMTRIQQFKPDTSVDIFRELQYIEQMFGEVSGIREIMKGGSESGVRAAGHADLLSRLGSSRAKKKAFILEDAVEQCATLFLKHIKKNDATHYKNEKETSFVAKHLTDKAVVKVDAHSSSPIFIEQQLDKAKILFEAQAIGPDDLLDAMNFPNAEKLKVKLRKRMEEAAKMQAMEAAKEQQGGAPQ